MNETIYILLPVHNRREVTRQFISCLKQQTYANYHLVLIDDGSSDGTAAMVKETIEQVTVITGKGTWWWGGALDQGYRWLISRNLDGRDIVLIINDDTEFDRDFLEKAVVCFQKDQKTFLLAQCYDKKDNTLIDAGIHINWKRFTFELPSEAQPINCLSTRGLFCRVEDFFRAGGFHPFLLPHYLSDYEFTIRAQRRGIELKTEPALRIKLDTSTTGYHDIQKRSFLQALKIIFSPKSAINPMTLMVFIALACPWRYKPAAWLTVIKKSLYMSWKTSTEKNVKQQ